jgi:hypothetical protein
MLCFYLWDITLSSGFKVLYHLDNILFYESRTYYLIILRILFVGSKISIWPFVVCFYNIGNIWYLPSSKAISSVELCSDVGRALLEPIMFYYIMVWCSFWFKSFHVVNCLILNRYGILYNLMDFLADGENLYSTPIFIPSYVRWPVITTMLVFTLV